MFSQVEVTSLVATRLSLGPVSKVTNNLKEDVEGLRIRSSDTQHLVILSTSVSMLSLLEAFPGPFVQSNRPYAHSSTLLLHHHTQPIELSPAL